MSVSEIHRGSTGLVIGPDADHDSLYFPVGWPQIKTLVGVVLTHIDACGLPAFQNDAVKSLVRQSIQRWFSDVQENSLTSYRGCIGPIEVLRNVDGTERKYLWHGEGNHAVSVSRPNTDE